DTWEQYVERLDRGELPLGRALPAQPRELLIREMILQMKTGRADRNYLRGKFGQDILQSFADPVHRLEEAGQLPAHAAAVGRTRPGLLQVDRFLPEFFEERHRGARYT